jgi:hypothetical protein
MLFALSLATSHAFTCPAGGADPVCDQARAMVDAANAAYPGSDPIFEGARGRKDEDRVLARLRESLDQMVGGGCLSTASAQTWVAGAYGPGGVTGQQDGVPLTSASLTRTPKTFQAVGSDTFGESFGTYNKNRQIVGDFTGGDYTYGFFVQVLGTNGVFFAFGNTCDGPVEAAAALQGVYRGDVSALFVPDGVCAVEGDPDCDGFCDLPDAAGPDCDGVCDIGDTSPGPDCLLTACDFEPGGLECCDEVPEHPSCDGGFATCMDVFDPTCDGICDPIDDPFGPDCSLCEPGDLECCSPLTDPLCGGPATCFAPGDMTCNGICEIDDFPFGPDCTGGPGGGSCDEFPGSFECCFIENPGHPSCGFAEPA